MTMLDGKESFRAIERGGALSGRWGQHGPVHLSWRASREETLVKRKESQMRKAARAAKPRLDHSLCLPAGVPSDQFVTATKDTRIGGSPFIWGCSFGEKNQ